MGSGLFHNTCGKDDAGEFSSILCAFLRNLRPHSRHVGRLQLGATPSWTSYVLIAPTPMLQLALLGTARLEPGRIAGMSLPLLAVSVGIWVIYVCSGRMPGSRPFVITVAVGLTGVVGVGLASISQPWSRDLCCEIAQSKDLLSTVQARENETGAPRLILANPDLGKVSFNKATVTVDLGLLGSPLLTEAYGRGGRDKIPDLLNRVLTRTWSRQKQPGHVLTRPG